MAFALPRRAPPFGALPSPSRPPEGPSPGVPRAALTGTQVVVVQQHQQDPDAEQEQPGVFAGPRLHQRVARLGLDAAQRPLRARLRLVRRDGLALGGTAAGGPPHRQVLLLFPLLTTAQLAARPLQRPGLRPGPPQHQPPLEKHASGSPVS